MSESNEEINQAPLIGTVIRKAREKKNVSVKIVAQHTKISSTNLEALEANDFSKLPNQAYVRGYVKSCSKLLGLNEGECLDILEANYEALEKPQRVLQKIEEKKEQESKENNQLIIKMLSVVAVVIIFVALITSNDDSKKNAPAENENITIIEEDKVEESIQETITPVVLSKTTPLKAEEAPVAVATPVATPEPTPEATPTPKVVEKKKEEKKDEDKEKKEIELRQISGKLYGFDSKATSDQLEEWLPSNFKAPVVDGKQNVFIHAIDGDTWLTYQVDGGEIKKFVLKKDQKLFVSGEEVLFFLGNYNVAKIFLNNKLLDISSRSGVKSLVFPQEKASEHYYPLFIYKDDGSVVNSKTYKSQL
ncbi:MAG: hypothetical protein COV38_09130 [Bdellovibrionales bacterium CG11_big_fil_rev_8_21_14_0_20_38_13]|nr:MAG: hypothetical protein COV38_09130 [Bdellovibrionales bacterium CG11_big_fil_rev_8_21_14_0_20_38_13]